MGKIIDEGNEENKTVAIDNIFQRTVAQGVHIATVLVNLAIGTSIATVCWIMQRFCDKRVPIGPLPLCYGWNRCNIGAIATVTEPLQKYCSHRPCF